MTNFKKTKKISFTPKTKNFPIFCDFEIYDPEP